MTFLKLQQKYLIKIPKTIDTIYCKENQFLIFKGPLKIKTFKVSNKILLLQKSNAIAISPCFISSKFRINSKKAKIMQGTIIAQLKYILIEICYNLYSKLNFVGVGYRAFLIENFKNQFYFKLGYSHLLFFRIPSEFNAFCVKFTKLFIFGNVSYQNLTQTASQLRDCKKPEPYKGKGILFYEEKIKLKKGKKI